MKYQIKVGIIGGSGLDDPDILSNRVEKHVPNIFGDPSDVLIEGKIQDVPCVLLARHGRNHSIMPSHVNYRANIWALKLMGCSHIIAFTACGSLKEEVAPGDIVIFDSFIDRTKNRKSTFYDNSCDSMAGICHLPMDPAFCSETRKVVIRCAEKLNIKYHPYGTCVTIEGPRFSSKAESRLYKSWNCDVINMTTVPEVSLAKEASICYAAIGLVTDYDCWRSSGDGVNVADVLSLFKANVEKAKNILTAVAVEIKNQNWDRTIDCLKEMIASNTIIDKKQKLND